MTARVRDALRLWRWLLNVECSEPFCHQRRICWRWHIETRNCRLCGHLITEADPNFAAAEPVPYLHIEGPPLTSSGAGIFVSKTWGTFQ